MSPFRNKRRIWWFALVLGAVVALLLILVPATTRDEVLSKPPVTQKPKFTFLGSLRAPIRSAWQKAKWKVFGPPRYVELHVEVFEMNDSLTLPLRPASSSNALGTRIWTLGTNELDALEWTDPWPRNWNAAAFERPRLRLRDRKTKVFNFSTFDGIGARTSRGDMAVDGVTLRESEFYVLPRTHGPDVDLEWFLTETERPVRSRSGQPIDPSVIRTNAIAGAHIHVPREESVFLLTAPKANGKRTGVIITPKVYQPKKL
jgi:hypothetical protein